MDGFTNLILKGREELDLRDQAAVEDFFMKERPEFVFLQLPRLEVLWPIVLTGQILYTRTFRFRTT